MHSSPDELRSLINSLCNGALTAEGRARLEQLLVDDSDAQELYLDYIDVHLKIVDKAEHGYFDSFSEVDLWNSANAESASNDETQSSVDSQKVNLPLSRRRIPHFQASSLVLASIAAVSVFVAAVATLLSGDKHDSLPGETAQSATQASRQPSRGERSEDSFRYVAQIAAMSDDVAWGEASGNREFLLRIRQGEQLQLRSGLVRVNYFSGASLVLRGPCSFAPTGRDSGELYFGELTGEVTAGNFLLTTPTARVIDLGTAFGVSVDSASNTNVHVFDGKVQVIAAGNNSEENSATQLLTEGMAIRAVRGGTLAEIHVEDDQFARELPVSAKQGGLSTFSLVDAFSSDEYKRFRLANAIAPDTGDAYEQSELETEQAYPRKRLGTYHTTRWHPFVDGLFIPTNEGVGEQCDSTGRTIDLVPNGANTSGPVWSRRRIEDTSSVIFNKNFWGRRTRKRVLERLRSSSDGMIGIHANVGLTFDLDAIRNHCGRGIRSFSTTVANLDNSDENAPGDTHEKRFIADFRAFVDGELRASRLGFGRTDGDMQIEITIDPEDRFLTFVSTDAGHYWYDQVVMIDPALVLVPAEQTLQHSRPPLEAFAQSFE